MSNSSTRITLNMPESLTTLLKEEAEKNFQNRSQCIVMIISKYFKDKETDEIQKKLI